LKLAEQKDEGFEYEIGVDASDPTVQELEFALNNDAKNLVQQSDVSVLSERDVNILKLIIAAGLYPNLAISDEANYARPVTEHVYHSKGKRYSLA
jgi:ATP-dependent RNA helicase DHX34